MWYCGAAPYDRPSGGSSGLVSRVQCFWIDSQQAVQLNDGCKLEQGER